jgi:hypothetical protein
LPGTKDYCHTRISAKQEGLLPEKKKYLEKRTIIARHERSLQGTEITASHEGL